jgi:3-oxoacyl-[acyl-carrier protein] reductase
MARNRKKVALVTGASGGLGGFIALALSKKGYHVIMNYYFSEESAAEVLKKMRGDSIAVRADVRNPQQVKAMADRIDSVFGRLDVIINNAGIAKDALLLKQTEQEWDEIIDTNLKGCFNIIKTIAPIMIRSGGGHIVNISSYSGVKGKAGQGAYSASKSALLGLTFTVSHELAEHGIKVNAVLPGYLLTAMGLRSQKGMETAKESSIVKQFSSPEDVADFIVYLVNTKDITGQVFSLDSRII